MTTDKHFTKPTPEMLDYEDCRPGPGTYPKAQADEIKKQFEEQAQPQDD